MRHENSVEDTGSIKSKVESVTSVKDSVNINKKSVKKKLTSEYNSDVVLPKDEHDDSQDDDIVHKSGISSKIKYLPPSVLKDIEQKNLARKLAGLQPIRINIRPCLTCGAKFQSAGNRTCGCTSRSAGIIAGREII